MQQEYKVRKVTAERMGLQMPA